MIVMSENQFQIIQEQQRSNWVRLSTLVLLRWFAIGGQILAVFAAIYIFGLQIEYQFAALIIGLSVFANLISGQLFSVSRRLTEREARLVFLFDIAQLGLLLAATGGLNNPFALLILAPVTISSTALGRRSMILVGGISILIITILTKFHLPIYSSSGEVLSLPSLFLFGYWLALTIGVVFLSGYARRVTAEMHAMGDALLATQMALSREQKLTDLGGVVAATAHELGTPLATIKLVSSELADDLKGHQDFLDDVNLIAEQADRCREILRSMGRAGKNDLHLQNVPLEAIVKEAAEPHTSRGIAVLFDIAPEEASETSQPIVSRRPEVIHGLRNLIQNAVDFASSRVEIAVAWTETKVTVKITDDGAGFPLSVLSRIGDPFVGRRRAQIDRENRPEYHGMGLGLFIAKTLLERSRATLRFSNEQTNELDGQTSTGASVLLTWSRSDVEISSEDSRAPLGENKEFLPNKEA